MKALVTAGLGGIGSEIVKLLEDRGIHCLKTSSRKINGTLYWDMTNPDSIENLKKHLQDIDIFIHCAHIFSPAKLSPQIKTKEFADSLHNNLIPLFELTKLVARSMNRRKKGKIIFLGSLIAKKPAPGKLVYITEKMAMMGMLSAFQSEFRELNFHIVHPALTETDQIKEKIGENIKQHVGELLSPHLVAKKIVDIVHDDQAPFEIIIQGDQQW